MPVPPAPAPLPGAPAPGRAGRPVVPPQRAGAARADRRPSAPSLRRLEPWRDAAALGLLNHAVLVAAVVLQPHGWRLLLLALPLALGLGTGTLTVLHDAGHRMFSARTWPNVLAVQLTVPAGLWVGHWTLKHRVHHKLTMAYELDEATRATPALRLHPEAPLSRVHRYQHLYAWFFYSLAWAGELKSQLTYLRTGKVTETATPGLGGRLASFLLEKGLWLAVLAPYAWGLGVVRLAVLLLVGETLASLLAAVLTVVGHVNVGLVAIPGHPGRQWTAHLVRTTASFQLQSRFVRFWTGGLTHHLAHHLRPVALRSELPAVHETAVRDVVAASGVPQSVYPTLRAAVAAHARRLRELGRPVDAPPVPVP